MNSIGQTMRRTFETHFFNKQIAYAVSKNIDGLINQYHEHAIIVYLDTIIRGCDNIYDFLTLHSDHLHGLTVHAIEHYTEADNIITVQGVFLSDAGKVRAQCVSILHQGKVLYQIVMLNTWTGGTAWPACTAFDDDSVSSCMFEGYDQHNT